MFFGSDLTHRYGALHAGRLPAPVQRRQARPARRARRAPGTCTRPSAAREIKEFSPDARIMVVLRNPVDVMYAAAQPAHLQRHRGHPRLRGTRSRPSPTAAPADASRPGPINIENLFYRHSVHFAEQLERYFEVFGRERVHVMLYDDLRRDGASVVRGCLEFLGVDPSAGRAAAARRMRTAASASPLIQRLIFAPRLLLPLAPFLRRFPLVRALRTRMLDMNSEAKPRAPMDPGPAPRAARRVHARRSSAWAGSSSATCRPGSSGPVRRARR